MSFRLGRSCTTLLLFDIYSKSHKRSKALPEVSDHNKQLDLNEQYQRKTKMMTMSVMYDNNYTGLSTRTRDYNSRTDAAA